MRSRTDCHDQTPNRPNPIGYSPAELVERKGNILVVKGLDAIEGTPLIDLKPHIPRYIQNQAQRAAGCKIDSGGDMMRIIIPTDGKKGLEDSVAQHFGRCMTYTILDEHGNLVDVIDNTSEHMGGSGLPPEIMKEHGADVLLCKDLGPRAVVLCKELGIDVYVGDAETVKGMFNNWKEGNMKKADIGDACTTHQEGI